MLGREPATQPWNPGETSHVPSRPRCPQAPQGLQWCRDLKWHKPGWPWAHLLMGPAQAAGVQRRWARVPGGRTKHQSSVLETEWRQQGFPPYGISEIESGFLGSSIPYKIAQVHDPNSTRGKPAVSADHLQRPPPGRGHVPGAVSMSAALSPCVEAENPFGINHNHHR